MNEAKTRKPGLAFASGAMFMLAGVLEFLTGFHSHGSMRTTDMSMGVMFLCIGLLWMAIGAKWKKEVRGQ